MANKLGKKVGVKPETPDYFKLPFEVHYREAIPVTIYEFKTDVVLKSFKDVKAVHMEQGNSWGASFFCQNNNGPELYCCLINGHGEVNPPWLQFQGEANIDFNFGCDFSVVIERNQIIFKELTEEQNDEDSEDYLNVDNMDYCCSDAFHGYVIGEATPEFIVLDSHESRLKIDLDGYELDEEGKRIESRRIINTEDLDDDKYQDYETSEIYDAKFEWVKSVLSKYFKKDTKLSLSFYSE